MAYTKLSKLRENFMIWQKNYRKHILRLQSSHASISLLSITSTRLSIAKDKEKLP